jgi:hypothetical protein
MLGGCLQIVLFEHAQQTGHVNCDREYIQQVSNRGIFLQMVQTLPAEALHS